MLKQSFSRVKKSLAILLAVLFVASLTVASASACSNGYKGSECKENHFKGFEGKENHFKGFEGKENHFKGFEGKENHFKGFEGKDRDNGCRDRDNGCKDKKCDSDKTCGSCADNSNEDNSCDN